MDIAYVNLYRTEEIGFLLYAVMIGLIIWNFKKSTNVSLLVNCFSAIGLIFYQYFILKQQIVVEASYASAIASVICICNLPPLPILPTCFSYAWNFAFVRELPKTNTTYAKLAKVTMRPTANSATGVFTSRKFLLSFLFYFKRRFSHNIPSLFCKWCAHKP